MEVIAGEEDFMAECVCVGISFPFFPLFFDYTLGLNIIAIVISFNFLYIFFSSIDFFSYSYLLSCCVYIAQNENDCIYRFDFSSVYWNSRLQMEHGRLIREEFTPGDVVCDACAGVGPFALPAAKSGCHVIANDLNPTAVLYLHENIRINKLDNRVEVYNLDAMELMKLLVQKKVTFHHVIFNLPASAVPLLGSYFFYVYMCSVLFLSFPIDPSKEVGLYSQSCMFDFL